MIKTFIAANAEKAQAKARRALGHNAIVLNIRDLPSGDVELTAGDHDGARDYRLTNPNPITPPLNSADRLPEYISQPVQNPPDQPDYTEPNQHANAPQMSDKTREIEPDMTEKKKGSKFSLFSRKKKEADPVADGNDQSLFTPPSPNDGDQDVNHAQHDDDHSQTPASLAASVVERERVDSENHVPPSSAGPRASSAPPHSPAPQRGAPIVPAAAAGAVSAGQRTIDPGLQGARLHETIEQKSSENTLSQLRERLTGQGPTTESTVDDPRFANLSSILNAHGISERLMAMILNGARSVSVEDDLYRMGVGLSQSFNFSPLKSTAAVPIMLVGPTGAGKTSCAAKLSAIALNDGEGAMMITTDVGRAGALEQFATYSEKLAIECYAAETPEELTTIMREAQPQGAVILDTPGISPYDAGDLAALKSFQTAIGAEPVLVLPASGDVGEYSDWAHAFRAFGVRSCIITKFDATRRVGAGLSAAFEGNMTLTYFSETPFISEGLLAASPEFLAYRLTANYPGRIVQQ